MKAATSRFLQEIHCSRGGAENEFGYGVGILVKPWVPIMVATAIMEL
jgi:hypothetical protein